MSFDTRIKCPACGPGFLAYMIASDKHVCDHCTYNGGPVEPCEVAQTDVDMAKALGPLEYKPAATAYEHPTLRDEFALSALNGMLAHGSNTHESVLAVVAYKYADAMLEARKANKR